MGNEKQIHDLSDPTNWRFLQQAACEYTYFTFFQEFWHTVSQEELRENWHLKLIADELQIVGEWIINRQPKKYDLVINVPPGSSKSTLATVLFPVWLWINDPSIKVISGSYSSSLSINHAALSRDCIDSNLFQDLFGDRFSIRRDFDAKTLYRTDKGGMRLVTSSGSSVIGEHGHVLIVDDPIDPKGAKSETIMASVNDWFFKTLPTRKVDKANTPTILIMQRLTESDPAGELLKKAKEEGKAIRHICLPASDEYPIHPLDRVVDYNKESKTVKDRYQEGGGLLDPIRMPERVLKEYLITLGSAEYAGQFGQQPRAAKGNIIQREWLPILPWSKIPRGAMEAPRHFVADTAYKEKQENDPSGCLCYSEFRNYLFVWNYMGGRFTFPDLLRALTRFVKDHGDHRSILHVEPKASGVSVVQSLREYTDLNAVEWKMAEGDKVARVNGIAAKLEAQRVILVEGSWNESFVEQCLVFPRGAHDEEVDCLVMAVQNALIRKPSGGYSYGR